MVDTSRMTSAQWLAIAKLVKRLKGLGLLDDPLHDGMICDDCRRPFTEVIDFLVADVIWNYVMGRQESTTLTIRKGLFDERLQPRSEGVGGVVCLACFDQRAQSLNIEYREHLVVLGRESWMGGSYEDGMPI